MEQSEEGTEPVNKFESNAADVRAGIRLKIDGIVPPNLFALSVRVTSFEA